jgi:hypothetical protein
VRGAHAGRNTTCHHPPIRDSPAAKIFSGLTRLRRFVDIRINKKNYLSSRSGLPAMDNTTRRRRGIARECGEAHSCSPLFCRPMAGPAAVKALPA